MVKLDIKKSAEVNASADKTWEVLGLKFLQISEWARSVTKSWVNESVEKAFDDAPAGGRYCEVNGFGTLDERIIHFDAGKREISWSAKDDRTPKFVSGLQNALKVEAIDETRSRVTSNITADLGGLRGFLLGSMMKKKFSKSIDALLKDLQVYVETGKVSEAKQSMLTKVPRLE